MLYSTTKEGLGTMILASVSEQPPKGSGNTFPRRTVCKVFLKPRGGGAVDIREARRVPAPHRAVCLQELGVGFCCFGDTLASRV